MISDSSGYSSCLYARVARKSVTAPANLIVVRRVGEK